MNIKTILNRFDSDTFITDYLMACGIEDVYSYLSPDNQCFEDYRDYPMMEDTVKKITWLFDKHKPRISIVVDSDCDGYCSSAVIYNFLKHIGQDDITIYHHEGKQHGVKDIIPCLPEKSPGLLIIPDAGTNDAKECKELVNNGWSVLILDHHTIEKKNEYAFIINNQVPEVENHALSGTGVADKFVRAYCDYNNIAYPGYSDLVAVSLITDVCDITTLENRAYINEGFNNVTNPFLQFLFDKLCKRNGINSKGIGWNVGPLANALARSDDQESKGIFFDGLTGRIEPEEALKQMRKVKRLQDDEVKSVVSELEDNLNVETKVILGFVEPTNANYTGLIANKFTGRYNKPTILLRDTGRGGWSGSLRSPVPLLSKINESGIATAQGHEEACGVIVKKKNLTKFQTWLENLDLSEKPDIEVTAEVVPEELTLGVCKAIEENKILWGHGIESPRFYMKLNLTQDNVFIYEKNTTTIKLDLGCLNCIKFSASKADVDNFKKYEKFTIELVVNELSVNEWEGIETPQCMIADYEISKQENKVEDWEDLF